MNLKYVFFGLALLIGSGLVNFFVTVLLFNPLHNDGIAEIDGTKHTEEAYQKTLEQIQDLSEERIELQQDHLQLIKQYRKLQQRTIKGEIEEFREDILSLQRELGKTRKELEKAQEKFSENFEKKKCRRCDCSGEIEETLFLQKAIEVHYGFRTNLDSGMTDKVNDLTRNVKQIPRIDGNTLSYKQFYLNYVKTQTPLVITNYHNIMFSQNWTLDFISSYCGKRVASLHHFDPSRLSWGNLYQERKRTLVSDFIDSVKEGTSGNRYLFDWSINRNCPKLLEDTFTVPKYFATDFFQRISNQLWNSYDSYKHTWPSLFIGNGATASGLHVDAVQSHFWMAMISGHKRWAVVTPSEVPFLYPHPEKTTYLIGDIFDVNLKEYPLVSLATIWETVLGPGDIIFVPGGSAHQIRNLDTIVSISMNYLDGENIGRSTPLLQSHYPHIGKFLLSNLFQKKVPSKQRDLTWEEFKTWPRDNEIYDLD